MVPLLRRLGAASGAAGGGRGRGDFDNDGACSISDFNLFIPDFQSTADSGLGSDMDENGVVGVGDFNLLVSGFQASRPGP